MIKTTPFEMVFIIRDHMTVTCIHNRSSFAPVVLPKNRETPFADDNSVASSEWYTIDASISGYCVSVSQEYKVYGLLIYDSQVRYLLLDDNNIPGFFPSALFLVHDASLFFDWQIGEYLVNGKFLFFIGNPLLTKSYRQLVDLIDSTEEAIDLFLEYKEYMINYEL